MTRNHNAACNDDGGVGKDLEGNLSISTHSGRLWGEAKKKNLSLDEFKAAQTYILLYCKEYVCGTFARRTPESISRSNR